MNKRDVIIGLFIALVLSIVLSPFASPWPDGLEKVAEDKGFISAGDVRPALASPVPDYAWPGVKHERMATSIAGMTGTMLVFILSFALAKLISRKNAA